VEVDGLCMSHYRQQLRGRPLTPLRKRADRERLSGIRVSEAALAELGAESEARKLPVNTIAGDVLETWAKRRGSKRRA
jgi:hypothetical protein